MKEYIPLLQTALWVGLISAIFFRYHELFEGIARSLHRRIDSGSGLRIGPVELSELVRPLDAQQQTEKLDEDVSQIVEAEVSSAAKPGLAPPDKNSIRREYVQAEDLVLREIQSEFETTINRQIQLKGYRFDGAFAKNGRLHIIEIKYSRSLISPAMIERSLKNLLSRTQQVSWKNFKIIFVVVFGNRNVDLLKEKERLQNLARQYANEIEVRTFHLGMLAEKFGIEPQPNETGLNPL